MNGLEIANAIKEVKEAFGSGYKYVDEEFLEIFKEEINTLKEIFSEKGGVHIVDLGEYNMICRLPSVEHMKAVNKSASSNRDGFEVDRELLSYCLLYPTIDVVNQWVSEGKIGIVSSTVRKLMELGLVNKEAQAKKL
jgi:hypothetical protein